MREWLDNRRFEPDVFRHSVVDGGGRHNSRAVQERRRGHCFRWSLLGPARV